MIKLLLLVLGYVIGYYHGHRNYKNLKYKLEQREIDIPTFMK